jgi:hypothetical protein
VLSPGIQEDTGEPLRRKSKTDFGTSRNNGKKPANNGKNPANDLALHD